MLELSFKPGYEIYFEDNLTFRNKISIVIRSDKLLNIISGCKQSDLWTKPVADPGGGVNP